MEDYSTISLEDLLEGDDISFEDSSSLNSSLYTESDLPSLYTSPPSAKLIEQFKQTQHTSTFFSTRISETPISNRYDLNWLDIDSYVSNWNVLSPSECVHLKQLVLSDLETNTLKKGVKSQDLSSHLLLAIGCDMQNILHNAHSFVGGNLKSFTGQYSKIYNKNRTVDPRSCYLAYKKFINTYSVGTLFKTMNCYQGVVTLDKKHYPSLEAQKEDYLNFFKSNNISFSKLANKSKKMLSYLYSNEISVDSILDQSYRPHTHLLFFIPKEHDPDTEQYKVLELKNKFNAMFSDRSLSILEDSQNFAKKASSFPEIFKMLNYLFRCYSLSAGYARETGMASQRELNQKTVETYHNLVYFFKKEEHLPSVRRFNHSYIPTRDEAQSWNHPLLQNRKRSLTIKKINNKRSYAFAGNRISQLS